METLKMIIRFLLVTSLFVTAVQSFPLYRVLQGAETQMKMNNTHAGHKMYYHFSHHATILFHSWHTMTPGQMVGSCIMVAIISAFYEAFKVFRMALEKFSMARWRSKQRQKNPELDKGASENGVANQNMAIDEKETTVGGVQASFFAGYRRMPTWGHFDQAVLHFIQIWLSMSLMLVFMTFNFWLCLSVALGGAIGYYLTGWIHNTMQINDHCQ